jgi:hypothetical protein
LQAGGQSIQRRASRSRLQVLSFGAQKVKTTSAAKTVTITNNGTTTLGLGGFTVKGDFDQSSDCDNELSGGASCTVQVTFKPIAKGARNGDLDILSDAGGGETHVKLSGSGN